MISILITSQDKKSREDYAIQITTERNVEPIDLLQVDKDTFGKKETKQSISIGIEDIRSLYNTLFLKPVKSPLKAVIIRDAQLLTPEAQNALLKILEEPPAQTLFLLTADSQESLLPTVRSRCKLIAIAAEVIITAEEREEYQSQINNLQTQSIVEALKLAETISKNKTDTVLWLEKVILLVREQLLQAIHSDERPTSTNLHQLEHLLRNLQHTHTTLKKTNANPRLTLENLFLSAQETYHDSHYQ